MLLVLIDSVGSVGCACEHVLCTQFGRQLGKTQLARILESFCTAHGKKPKPSDFRDVELPPEAAVEQTRGTFMALKPVRPFCLRLVVRCSLFVVRSLLTHMTFL